jgi:gamma-glutamyltranspeptidase/glutathione hydrolase
MSPTIVLDRAGNPVIVTGSPGGGRIIAYVVKSLVGMIDWELDPAAAAALPNLAVDGNRLILESPGTALADMLARPRDWLAVLHRRVTLKALGQETRLEPMTSGVHAIRRRPDGRLESGADPRREGVALGD